MKVLALALGMQCITLFCFSQDQASAFDFWVGEWKVSWYGSDSILVSGQNTIEKILDGKVIQENFVDPSRNFKGKSLSVFNPQTKTWHQAWADNQGGYYNFVGNIENNERIFITPDSNAKGYIERMIFLDIKKDTFTWKWQGKKEDEREWKDQWTIYYQRKE